MLHHCHGGQQQLSCHRCSVRIPNVSKDQRWRGSLPATVEPQRLDLPSALEQPNTRRNIRSSGFQSGCHAVKGSSSWETGTEAYAVSVPAERLEFLGRRVGRQVPGSFGHPHWLEELELTVRKYLGDESLQGRWQERAVRREVWRREGVKCVYNETAQARRGSPEGIQGKALTHRAESGVFPASQPGDHAHSRDTQRGRSCTQQWSTTLHKHGSSCLTKPERKTWRIKPFASNLTGFQIQA